MHQISHYYQHISNIQTQIDGDVHQNVKLNKWLEDVKRFLENVYSKHKTIDDGTSCDEEVDINQNKIKHVNAIKYFTLRLQWPEK